jgi:hypothetical protein
MGGIMSVGVAVANAILLITFAERFRREGMTLGAGRRRRARSRLRPILMTSFAMIAGMIPMAIGAERRRRAGGAAGAGGHRRTRRVDVPRRCSSSHDLRHGPAEGVIGLPVARSGRPGQPPFRAADGGEAMRSPDSVPSTG